MSAIDLATTAFAGGGYHIHHLSPEEYLVEHTPATGRVRGEVHGTLWPTRRAALEAVLRDLHARWGVALEAGDLQAVQDMATTTTMIVSYFLRRLV